MFSGKDGKIIYSFVGDNNNDYFGISVGAAGDINGDGYADVIVGASQGSSVPGKGYARIFSGVDGKVLHTLSGLGVGDEFGFSVRGAGDINLDGSADVIVGAVQGISAGAGYAQVLSGKDGKVLRTFSGKLKNDRFGHSVSGIKDINADLYPDLLIGAPAEDSKGADAGSARAFSGKDGSVIYTFGGAAAGDWCGCAVRGAGDVNRDGYEDLVVGAYLNDKNGLNSGIAEIFSGKNGTLLLSFTGDSAGDAFGFSVATAGDLNRDGCADIVVGAPDDDNNGTSSGIARVLSGKELSLWSDLHQLSLKQAGTQKLSLAAGAAHAGGSYWIFGSASGTAPGITLGGVHIPLNVDWYTDLTISAPNSTLLASFRGKLDGSGKAWATFNLPSGLPSTVDITLYHAFLVYDAQGTWHMGSNPVTLHLAN